MRAAPPARQTHRPNCALLGCSESYDKVTAVTARDDGVDAFGDELRDIFASSPDTEIIVGNWKDEAFMRGRHFDVVVA